MKKNCFLMCLAFVFCLQISYAQYMSHEDAEIYVYSHSHGVLLDITVFGGDDGDTGNWYGTFDRSLLQPFLAHSELNTDTVQYGMAVWIPDGENGGYLSDYGYNFDFGPDYSCLYYDGMGVFQIYEDYPEWDDDELIYPFVGAYFECNHMLFADRVRLYIYY